jgi:methylated-DNA-[protein]-cysteine S-methyltransferase
LIQKLKRPIIRSEMQSPLGPITLAAHDDALVGIWFENQKHSPPDMALWTPVTKNALMDAAAQQLLEYFAGKRKHFDVPLDLTSGTAFQQSVWQILLTIAPGETVSYGTVGQRIGKPGAVRAVGAAVGRNPFSIVVPCHRVIGTNGSLTGYAGGLDRKVALLTLEGFL